MLVPSGITGLCVPGACRVAVGRGRGPHESIILHSAAFLGITSNQNKRHRELGLKELLLGSATRQCSISL